MFSRFCVHELDSQAIPAELLIHINREPIEANDELPSRVTRRSDHLQDTSGDNAGGDNAANNIGQVLEAEHREQAGGGALNLDEESGGAVLAEDAEELGGVSSDVLGGSGEARDSGNLGDDGADGALDVGQVKAAAEEAKNGGRNLDKEGVAAEVGDGHDVGERVALHVASDAGSDTLESANQRANERANLRETKTGEETLNGGGELDESDGALGSGNGQETTGSTLQVQGADGRGNLDDLANGLGEAAEVQAGQEASDGRLKLDKDQLRSLVSDGQDAVDLASSDTSGQAGDLVSGNLSAAGAGANVGVGGGSSGGRGQAGRDPGGQRETSGDDARGQAAGDARWEHARSSTRDDVGGQGGDGGCQNGSGDGERLHLDWFRE